MDNKAPVFIRWYSLVLITLLGCVFWYMIFTNVGTVRDDTSTYTDKYSGEEVAMIAVNDRPLKNPHQPYFVGLETLKTYGVSDDDRDYIRAFLSDFFENKQRLSFAKISFIKNTYRQDVTQGLDRKYSFQVGINDGEKYTVSVTSNFVAEKISITLLRDSKKIQTKNFEIYQPFY